MKKPKAITLFSLLALSSAAFAQSIPAPAKATLAKLYPAATQVKWDKEDGEYEASFKNNNQSMSLVLDAKGTVKETETVITTAELPASVRTYVAKQLPGKKIKEAAIIVDAAGTKLYEAEVSGKDYMFDASGNPIKK